MWLDIFMFYACAVEHPKKDLKEEKADYGVLITAILKTL